MEKPVVLLPDFFARSVSLHKHRVAIDVPPGIGRPHRCLLTYAELETHANLIARALDRFVNRECVVAILLSRNTTNVYSSQLAVLKAGAAFTYIDPSFPDERVREILRDCEAVALLTDSQGQKRCCEIGYRKECVFNVAELIEKTRGSRESWPQPVWLTGESLAYIVYTSGTTGHPKGVMIEHRSIVNLVASDLAEFSLSPEARVGQSSSLAYDSSIEEIWLALAAGGTLVVMADNTRLASGAYLCPLSSLPSGGMIPENERWDGIPARPAGQAPSAPKVPEGAKILSSLQHGLLLVLMRFSIALIPTFIIQLSAVSLADLLGLDANRFIYWLFNPGFEWVAFLLSFISLAGVVAISLGLQGVVVRMLGGISEGVISVWSFSYIRVWLKTGMVQSAGEWLSGTLFWPLWLRMAGMRIGSGCEISTIIGVVPELVEIDHESFLADGIYLGGPQIHRGTATLAATHISQNTFLGNHVVIPAGQRLPENILLGICTVADDKLVRAGSSWFGHPPFELPKREVVECERRFTHDPSWIRYLTRMAWEMSRFMLPAEPLLIALIWLKALAVIKTAIAHASLLFVVVPLLSIATAALPCFLILILKWGTLGRVRPGQHPLWSCWCSRWDFFYVAWRFWAVPILTSLEGTPLLTVYLRAMGAKIGKRVVLGRGFAQVVDPDMMCIEDEATVEAMFQAHTFEDRVLKIDRIHICRQATMGAASVPIYGAKVGAGAQVAPHSVVMKHEILLPGFRYEGAPIKPASSQS